MNANDVHPVELNNIQTLLAHNATVYIAVRNEEKVKICHRRVERTNRERSNLPQVGFGPLEVC